MKFSKKATCTLLIGALFLVGACDGFLNVNEDPTSPTEVPENLQLAALLGVFSYNVIGNEPARTTTLWMQQTAWSGFTPTEDNYDLDESDVNNFWNVTYIQVLNNARELDELAEENGNYAYAAMAKVIKAWAYSILTDLWNEIPYSEALDPLNTSPAYDSQEFIYGEIIGLLEDALANFSQDSPLTPGSHDLLYGGDIELWERMTHTLMARFYMRLSNAPGYNAEVQAQAALDALSNGFTSNADDADFQYYATAGEENPWFQFAIDGKWDTRNQLSAHYIALLEDLDDPRLPVQARPAGAVDNNGLVADFDPETPEYVGHENGEEGPGASAISSIGVFYSAADSPLNWLSYAEARFIEAEATYLISGGAAAQSAYEEAIRSSMEKLGINGNEIDDYILARQELATSADPLNDIITQKYIANFLSYEVYNDWRRTGYPELEPVTNEVRTPSGIIPLRYPYPNSEISNNSENVSASGIPIGYSSLEIPVWWDSGN